MTRTITAGLLLIAMTGCGQGTPTTKTIPAPPHGGDQQAMPGGLGFVEVVVGDGKPPKSRNAGTVVTLYFFRTDAITPIDPPPGVGCFAAEALRKASMDWDLS